jgi:hypothetical protein
MKATNRDLLVLVKDESMNQQQIEMELEKLNSILFQLETVEGFCTAHEVFDIAKHRIVTNRKKIVQVIHQPELKPFQFVCNKN